MEQPPSPSLPDRRRRSAPADSRVYRGPDSQDLQAVTDAHEAIAPVNLSWGSGTADFAVNRRNNKEGEVPSLRTANSIAGPANHQVPVLAIYRETTLVAVVFAMPVTPQFSMPINGAAIIQDLRSLGSNPQTQAQLRCSGPAAEAIRIPFLGERPPSRATTANASAAAVEKVLLTTEMLPLSSTLRINSKTIDLPYDTLPTRDQLQKDSTSKNRYTAARATMLLERLKEDGALETSYPYSIRTWKLGGEIDFIFLGGEVVVDYATRLPRELHGTKTWVASYANDVMPIFPLNACCQRTATKEAVPQSTTVCQRSGPPGSKTRSCRK